MMQIWPGVGVAPVPTLVSVIFKPDGVVMVVPAAWAAAVVAAPAVKPASAVTRASADRARADRKARILLLLGIDRVRTGRLCSLTVCRVHRFFPGRPAVAPSKRPSKLVACRHWFFAPETEPKPDWRQGRKR